MKKGWIEKAVFTALLSGGVVPVRVFSERYLDPSVHPAAEKRCRGSQGAADLQGHRGRSGSIAD